MAKPKLYQQTMIIFLLLTFSVGAGAPTLNSSWRSSSMTIADTNSVWPISAQYTIDDKPIIIGLQNDGSNLYLLLKAEDRDTQMMIMRGGLTVWLDSKGGKNKKFGIRYPVGMRRPQGPPTEGTERPMGDPEKMRAQIESNMDSIEIIGPAENNRVKIPVKNDLGLWAVRSSGEGPAGFEFIIPLKESNATPYAISADAVKIIGIGIEAGAKMEQPGGQDGPKGMSGGPGRGPGGGGGMGPGGGGEPEGGGMGGGPPGGGRGGRPNGPGNETTSKPIKIWAKIKLAGASETK
jgi:hypothetical protein